MALLVAVVAKNRRAVICVLRGRIAVPADERLRGSPDVGVGDGHVLLSSATEHDCECDREHAHDHADCQPH
jgi:hypothetical protein